MDINDSKLEGFTYNPVIVFDNQIKHITSSTIATKEHLGIARTAKAAKLSRMRKTLNRPLSDPNVAQIALIGGTSAAVTSVQAGNFVRQYKRQHPNTNLSDWQITTMYMNDTENRR